MRRLAVLVMVVAAGLQPRGQEPVFRAGTIIIPLDISVLDKNKKPVTDLKQSDFTIFENKVKQDIRAFFPVKLEPEPTATPDGPALIRTPENTDPLAPRKRRTFLFVFGWGHIEKPMEPIDGTIDFIRTKLLPQDLVGVMLFDRASDLTRDHEYVAKVLERYKAGHDDVVQSIEDFYGKVMDKAPNAYGSGGPSKAQQLANMKTFWINAGVEIPPKIQAKIDGFFAVPGVPTGREQPRSAAALLLQSPELKPPPLAISSHMEVDEGGIIGCGDDWQMGPHPWNRRMALHDIEKVYAGIEYLRGVPGEKRLVWYSLTAVCGAKWSPQDGQRMAASAAAAHVALDIIHAAGPPAPGTPGIPVTTIIAGERVAELSGGQFSGAAYAREPLAWIDASTRFGYLIGYTPTNTKIDDKYRNVVVTVNRPDVTVVYRHGYMPEKDVPPAERRAQVVASRLTTGLSYRAVADDIVIHARASAAAGPGRRLMITATIDASRLSWVKQGDKHVAKLDVQVIAGDLKEKVIGKQQQTLDLAADEDTYQRYLASGIPYSVRLPVNGDPIYVKVMAYDFGADLLGTTYVKLR